MTDYFGPRVRISVSPHKRKASVNALAFLIDGATNRIACITFAVLNHEAGRGPARLRRLVWDQEIAGSNPAAPTTKAAHICGRFFCALFFFTQNETLFHPVPLRRLNMVSGSQRAHRCRELVFWFRTGEPPPGAAFL